MGIKIVQMMIQCAFLIYIRGFRNYFIYIYIKPDEREDNLIPWKKGSKFEYVFEYKKYCVQSMFSKKDY